MVAFSKSFGLQSQLQMPFTNLLLWLLRGDAVGEDVLSFTRLLLFSLAAAPVCNADGDDVDVLRGLSLIGDLFWRVIMV